MLKRKLLECIVTFAFVGKIKIAPGTFGSIAAFPFMYFILLLLIKYHILSAVNSYFGFIPLLSLFFIFACLTLVLFIIGVITSSLYIKHYSLSEDPKEIVIDEVVGQTLTVILCFGGSILLGTSMLAQFFHVFLLPFILFRIFDIFKPWPIDFIDQNVKDGLGVMLDDVLAAIFAAVTFYVIIFGILNFYPLGLV
jgi:phosphatidylglycerophosphatase A